MIWPILVVAAGLVFTLICMMISFWTSPPIVTFDMAAHAEQLNVLAGGQAGLQGIAKTEVSTFLSCWGLKSP